MADDTKRLQYLPIPSPVQQISGIWKFVRKPGRASRHRSLPGHLLHWVMRGEYQLRSNGRQYHIHPNDVIYYHESEEVEWLENTRTVTFLSIGFAAPTLPPLPLDLRVFPADRAIQEGFRSLYAFSRWPNRALRTLRTHQALLTVLTGIEELTGGFSRVPSTGDTLWWTLEDRIRRVRSFRPSLDDLATWAGCSRPTIVRACRRATGTSPGQRMRRLRMEEARGLLRFSALSISEIATYLGYDRLNEFSREFSKYFQCPPSHERK